MRALTLLAGIAPLMIAGAAQAQSGDPGQDQSGAQPNITVRAPERLVCRPVVRTATRMRASRQCRRVSEAAADALSDDDRIDQSADRLDALGADDLSTNCVGNPLDRSNDTPLGPR